MAKQAQNLINFTKSALENLPIPAAGRRLFFYDVKGNGLHVAVTSNGKKTFYIRRRINGKNEKHYIGPFPGLSIEKARDRAAMFAGEVASGTNPAESRRLLRGELTLGIMFAEYLERHLKKSRKRWEDTQNNFNRYFGDWAERKLSEISQNEVEARHSEIGQQRGPYAANRSIEIIRALYNKAIIWRLYKGHNPAKGITKFEERSRDRVLQSDEFERFFSTLDSEDADFRDFVMLALFTGARKSNVLSMSWQNLNLTTGVWTIPAELSKNKENQHIVLTEVELEILQRRLRDQGGKSIFVFPSSGRTGHVTDVKKAWNSFLARAAIEDLHIHDLRRSLASWMANTGANVSVIRGALNHKDVKTTLSVYALASKEAELAARRVAHRAMLDLGKSAGKS